MVSLVFVLCGVAIASALNWGENGDKQLNNAVSLAMATVWGRREPESIGWYYGPPPNIVDPLLVNDTSLCRRYLGDVTPVGTLRDVINRGKLRWCISAAEKGDVNDGGSYDVAKEDVPVLGVKAGDLYGYVIDVSKSITHEVALLLNTPIVADFHEVPASESLFFSAIEAMKNGECDVSFPQFFITPGRQKYADFTCITYFPDSTAIFSNINSFPADITGTLCSVKGTGQEAAAMNVAPHATFVYYDDTLEMWTSGFCERKCTYIVDETTAGKVTYESYCKDNGDLYFSVNPPALPSAGIGAFTLKSTSVEGSPASVVGVSLAAFVMGLGALLISLF